MHDLPRNQHALARVKGVMDDRITALHQFLHAAGPLVERMRPGDPVRHVVGPVKQPVGRPVPELFPKILFQMIFPDLRILIKYVFLSTSVIRASMTSNPFFSR